MSFESDMLARAESDLRDAEAASTAAQARAEAAQADAAVAAQRASEMRAVLDWLRAQSDAPRTPAEPVEPAMRFGKPVPKDAKTDLCVEALEKIGGSGSTRQVYDYLAREGHDLTMDQVRGALRYLANRKTGSPVETTPGTGQYRLRRVVEAGLPAANGAVVRS
jgi:hypothetical protein